MLIPVQIIVGRNTVDGVPLSAAAWGRFQARIIADLANPNYGEFYRVVEGLGIDMKGKLEQNATILGSYWDESLVRLEEYLEELKDEYEQGAVLLIVGELDVIS